MDMGTIESIQSEALTSLATEVDNVIETTQADNVIESTEVFTYTHEDGLEVSATIEDMGRCAVLGSLPPEARAEIARAHIIGRALQIEKEKEEAEATEAEEDSDTETAQKTDSEKKLPEPKAKAEHKDSPKGVSEEKVPAAAAEPLKPAVQAEQTKPAPKTTAEPAVSSGQESSAATAELAGSEDAEPQATEAKSITAVQAAAVSRPPTPETAAAGSLPDKAAEIKAAPIEWPAPVVPTLNEQPLKNTPEVVITEEDAPQAFIELAEAADEQGTEVPEAEVVMDIQTGSEPEAATEEFVPDLSGPAEVLDMEAGSLTKDEPEQEQLADVPDFTDTLQEYQPAAETELDFKPTPQELSAAEAAAPQAVSEELQELFENLEPQPAKTAAELVDEIVELAAGTDETAEADAPVRKTQLEERVVRLFENMGINADEETLEKFVSAILSENLEMQDESQTETSQDLGTHEKKIISYLLTRNLALLTEPRTPRLVMLGRYALRINLQISRWVRSAGLSPAAVSGE
jgi:hypothetical protein